MNDPNSFLLIDLSADEILLMKKQQSILMMIILIEYNRTKTNKHKQKTKKKKIYFRINEQFHNNTE